MLVKSVTYLVLLSSVLSACVATPPISTPPKKPTAIVNPSVPVAPPIIKQESSIATGTNISPLLPTPTQYFKIGKIRLPHLMNKACFVCKFITCAQKNMSWSCN